MFNKLRSFLYFHFIWLQWFIWFLRIWEQFHPFHPPECIFPRFAWKPNDKKKKSSWKLNKKSKTGSNFDETKQYKSMNIVSGNKHRLPMFKVFSYQTKVKLDLKVFIWHLRKWTTLLVTEHVNSNYSFDKSFDYLK